MRCERWIGRDDDGIAIAALAFVREHGARSIGMIDRIIGCPHEEGIDYPLGASCPQCPLWEGRDRWAGLPVHDVGAPPPALNLALHLGAIVAWMTAVVAEEGVEVTNVFCRRRPRGRRWRGQIVARFLPPDERIGWACPACGDDGIIDGWAGSPWCWSGLTQDDHALPN